MNCPACSSPDTISYWHKADDSLMTLMLKEIYPRARLCVDCGHVEHDTERRAWAVRYTAITRDNGSILLTPIPEGDDG